METSRVFEQSLQEMEQVLNQEHLGYLGLALDGQPYVVPLNYVYASGRILFHGALEGKKLDYIRANPQVCFTVGRQFGEVIPHQKGAVCHIDNDSVICYGIARIIEDVNERQETLNSFLHHLLPEREEITLEDVATCSAVEIQVMEMTGREERGGKCIYRRQIFG